MRNLVIVESPAKAKTIEKFLGKDYEVTSSYGHIRDLEKKMLGIDTEHNYEPNYRITDDKQKLVADLKKAASKVDMVWLASDEDREGEAISWHLKETLNLVPEKTKRIVFNEITKTAILNAIANPRDIDMNLVDAQQARRVLDRLVGYEISPILWSKIKPSLSAGRVQSVAVRLIVEREGEIRNFVSTSNYKVTAYLHVGGRTIAAELSRRFDNEEEVAAFLAQLKGASYTVDKVETKPMRRTPAPPFTTSTLQQEASRKLGYSVARTMQIAQQLYESGYITYMRTDSTNLSTFALAMAKSTIEETYGSRYAKTRQYATHIKGAQEAHEAIRPTDMRNATIEADASMRRLYELIWKRTVASQMSDAELEKTTVEISASTVGERFVCTGEQMLFDGFLKVYFESTDDEADNPTPDIRMLPTMATGTTLEVEQVKAVQHFSQHPPRYTEASLVKKLEDLGIGRPSTYAPTISTILKREYVSKEDREAHEVEVVSLTLLPTGELQRNINRELMGHEKGKLVPTDIGTIVNNFLMEHFPDVMDYNFTAKVEKDFDDIATGQKEWRSVIDQFYRPFHNNVLQTQTNSKRSSGERKLGVDPASGKPVFAKIGRYGALVQIGDTASDEKPRFASLQKGQSIETITLEEALGLFALPRTLGEYEGKEVVVSAGRFGPYVRHDDKFYSLSKNDDPYVITLERAVELIVYKRHANEERQRIRDMYPITIGKYEDSEVVANIGRFGPYLTYKEENYRLPKTLQDPTKLTLVEAVDIIRSSKEKKKKPSSRSRSKA
ncbi:MAG: type I DNA topoisomerase [Bacteroidales bacterium]|nr:type I DNA topoisomerase [Bacteroidales bacterium]